MANQAKIQAVAELADRIKRAQSIVLVDYQGINVNDETKLRKSLRESGGEYLVAKKSFSRWLSFMSLPHILNIKIPLSHTWYASV